MNVLITGASQGIGYETVKALSLYPNIHKIIVVSRNGDRLKDLVKECKHASCDVIPLLYDITSVLHSDNFAREVKEIVPNLSVLINNAGLLINKPFLDCGYEEARHQFDTNFFAPALLIKNLQPLLSQQQPSHVVNIGSMGGFQGSSKFAGLAYYSASKAALACLTECLATELAPHNIRINCLALGAVQTEMLSQAFPTYTAPLSAIQMGKFIANFALTASEIMNGQVIPLALTTP